MPQIGEGHVMDSLTLKFDKENLLVFFLYEDFNFLTLKDQKHEDNDQVAPYVRLWFWNPCRKELKNVQILAMLNGYRATRHQILYLMLLL